MTDFTSTFGPTSTWVAYPPVRPVRPAAVRVWDLPTRVFHWALLVCVTGAVVTAQVGGNWMDWHVRFGVSTLGLLVFRVVWGFIGPRYAHFRSFLYRPSAVLAHLVSKPTATARHAGHSPSGAVSVFAMLLVLVAVALSGLFSSDSISTDGALVRFASEATVSWATLIHVKLDWAIYVLVALHVAAVFAYLVFKKQDLIRPMLDGDKPGIQAPHADDHFDVRLTGLAMMLGSVWGALLLFGA